MSPKSCHAGMQIPLSRNDSVAWGSAVVPTAVFGVPPKTLSAFDSTPFGVRETVMELAGGTPVKATDGTIRELPAVRAGTVALPTELFRLRTFFGTSPLTAGNRSQILSLQISSSASAG